MSDDEELLARHPELRPIGQALREHRAGEAVTARCARCGQQLEVVEVPAAGVLVVLCPAGDTVFRARGAPRRRIVIPIPPPPTPIPEGADFGRVSRRVRPADRTRASDEPDTASG